jgi:hypothetical protein
MNFGQKLQLKWRLINKIDTWYRRITARRRGRRSGVVRQVEERRRPLVQARIEGRLARGRLDLHGLESFYQTVSAEIYGKQKQIWTQSYDFDLHTKPEL